MTPHHVRAVGQPVGVSVVGAHQKERGRVDGAAAYGDYVTAEARGLARAVDLRLDGLDGGPGRAGEEPRDLGAGDQRNVRQVHDLADAVDVGVGFCVHEAGVAVARVAADASALQGIPLVPLQAERARKGPEAELPQIVLDLLHARLVGDCRIRVLLASRRLGRVEALLAVNAVKPLRLGVIGLEHVVRDGPCGGDAALVVKDGEVFLAQSKQRRAVDLGVPTHPVSRSRVKIPAFAIGPHVPRVVPVVEKHRLRVPVGLLPRQERTALEDQDALSCLGEVIGERASAGAGPDDDDVVSLLHRHATSRRIGRGRIELSSPPTGEASRRP